MFDPEGFARDLVQARRARKLTDPGDHLPTDAAQAYAVQKFVAQQLGPVGAFKTACKPGFEQVFAPIFASDMGPSGTSFAALPGDTLAVELELGVRLRDDPPPIDSDDFSELLRALAEPVAVIELVGNRLKGAALQDRFATLADNQRNAGLVVSAGAPSGVQATGTVQAFLRAGDKIFLDGAADIPGGDPLATLEGLARMVQGHCGGLRKGQIVITGSLHPMVYLPAGTKIEGRLNDIGTVNTTIG